MEFRPLCFQVDGKKDVKLVGTQPNGELIYSWKEFLKDDSVVTRIGFMQYQNSELLEFLSLFGELDIVQASLSESRKYVAFVACTSGASGSNQTAEIIGTYQAHLMTVSPEPQMVADSQTVTNCHNFFINCHFLLLQQNERTGSTIESMQTEALVVLIHLHSIQVHKFSTESGNERLLCITESKVLALEFLWSQWIPQDQCLFFLKYADGMDFATRYVQDLSETVLCWIQFYNREEYELMMEIPASCLNVHGRYALQKQVTYLDSVNKISECRFNLHIITSSHGEVFVCHQSFESEYIGINEHFSSLSSMKSLSDVTDTSSYYTASSFHSSADSTKSNGRESFCSSTTKTLNINENSFCEDEVCPILPFVENKNLCSEANNCHQNVAGSHRTKYMVEDDALYHITVLHSSRRVSVFNGKSHSLKYNTLYFFLVEGGNVITWSPGQFAHMLDTRFCYGPNYCVVELNDDGRLSKYIMLKSQTALQVLHLPTGQCQLFIPGTTSLFTVHIDIEQLANEILSLRHSATSLDKRLSLIHCLSFHSYNTEALPRLIRAISRNPFEPQITDILKEIILGSALAGTEYDNHRKKHLTQYLTFFVLSYFSLKSRRHLQINLQPERRCVGEQLVYKELAVISIITATNRTLPLQCSLWNNFCYHLKMEFAARLGKTDYFFFFLKHVLACNRMHMKDQKRTSVFNGIKLFLACKKTEKLLLGEALEFLSTPTDYCSCVDSSQGKMFDALYSELKKRFPQEKPLDIQKIIESYRSHKEIQLYKLICMTFRLFEIRYDNETTDFSSIDLCKEEMLCLFAMLQHLQLASEQLLLSLPPRFRVVQAIIGFRCLSFSTFMQYVHRKMITLCSTSVEYLLKCNDESSISSLKKKILICSLPREQAISLLEKWNYHWNVKHHARNLKSNSAD